jgi:hypothetical protein
VILNLILGADSGAQVSTIETKTNPNKDKKIRLMWYKMKGGMSRWGCKRKKHVCMSGISVVDAEHTVII